MGRNPARAGQFRRDLESESGQGPQGDRAGNGVQSETDSLCQEERPGGSPERRDDDEFDDQRYVYLVGKDGKAAKKTVTVGQKTDKLLEIAEGLAEGDKVLLEAPKEK